MTPSNSWRSWEGPGKLHEAAALVADELLRDEADGDARREVDEEPAAQVAPRDRVAVHDEDVALVQEADVEGLDDVEAEDEVEAEAEPADVRALADLCSGTRTRLSLEVSSTGVALMAACHIAAAEPLVAHVEYHTVHQVYFKEFGLGPGFDPRTFTLPGSPGLGVCVWCWVT